MAWEAFERGGRPLRPLDEAILNRPFIKQITNMVIAMVMALSNHCHHRCYHSGATIENQQL